MRVFNVPAGAPYNEWAGLRSIVQVDRSGTRSGRPYAERHFYISSHTASADEFAHLIRGHWQVENNLHWVKDVILAEDACRTRAGYAPQNLAMLRSWAVTLFRLQGYRSISQALRRFAHDLPTLFRWLE